MDAVLPLAIAPQPEKIVRTFVGRVEVMAPWIKDNIVTALRDGDTAVLAKYGRFLQPFLAQIGDTPRAAGVDARLLTKQAEAGRARSAVCGK